ncbi:hypothetical protein GCM10025867_49440 (plasmid) [Frondihabitans sucicola]|uniref:Helicase C-terminal domain-containing protein n=2 Tax=Frondihabitans sucicola TaxID=1268041 RepID=A0ABN6YAZ7_9MICO|nr:hypothetical protein GCM10025867_49440 [Frondihabitans sucicola]
MFNLGGEVWNIADIISPDELGSKGEFVREWGYDTQKGVMISDPAALGSHLREIGLFHGHSAEEVGRAMPKPHVLELNCDADPAALDAIKGDAAEMARLILDRNTHRHTRFQAAGDLNAQFRQATGIAKAPFVAEYVRTLLASHERVILFGWHREVYDIWMDALEDFNPMLYTGSENSSRKDKSKNAFITGESRVLLMSLRSGAGVDGMQKVCNQVVFGELDWSPAVHKQGIGRASRPGMDMSRPVVAHYLVSDMGSDPVVAEALGIKRQQAEPLMSRDGELLGDVTAVENGHARALAEYILGASEAARLSLPDEPLAA